MRIRDLAYETASALDANRGRSLLTVLGIVIGISAVITMTALIGGIKQSLVGELGLNQARMVNIYISLDRSVTLDDAHALVQMMPEYEGIAPLTYASAKATSETKSFDASVSGTEPIYFHVVGLKFLQGESFTDQDEADGALVAVLDQGAVRNLYGKPDEQVVGRTVQINDAAYRVVGVVESDMAMSGEGGTAYIPFSTCASRLSGSWEAHGMVGLAREDVDITTIVDITKRKIQTYFNVDDETIENGTYIYTMQSVIDELDSMMGAFQLIMTAVASISLLVGGIGIMNMMLTNVTERIREIGLRKALGARNSDITKQFLLESVCLCLAGGVIGILLGYIGAYALAGLAGGSLAAGLGFGDTAITPVIDIKSVAMATGICVLIGILFGYYPARRAARLDPVESLHYQ